MAITLKSSFTFSVPTDIRDHDNGANATIKRTSADDIVPVVLEGSSNLNVFGDVKEGRYICFLEGATLDTMVKKRIDTITNKYNTLTGMVKYDGSFPGNNTRLEGIGTSFTTDLYENLKIRVLDKEISVKTIIDDTHLELSEPVHGIYGEVPFENITHEITLQNPRGEHWNDYPVADTLCMWAEQDNVIYKDDFTAECYYKIQSATTQQIVFDIEYTPVGAVDLKLERASYKFDITQERVRNEDIFNEDSYIYEAKDVASTISKNIYTWTNEGAGTKIALRNELGLTLEDQLIKLVLYPEGLTDNSEITVDVKENTLGKRFGANFSRV